MLRGILSIGGLTLLSRALGFLRDVLVAAALGAGPVADAFFVAFRLPNHFRSLFAEGAFNAAFVPMFSGILVQDGREAAQRFAAEVQALLLTTTSFLTMLCVVVTPALLMLFAPGFVGDPQRWDLAVLFTRITFPYLPMISAVALYGALLNSLGRFAAAASAPVMLNLCLIAALVGLTPLLPTAGHALAWGVLAAGAAQLLLVMWDARRARMPLPMLRPRLTPESRRFLAVLGPAALGAGLVQINLFADTLIASFLPTGAVSYLYYADRLNQLPLAVIGIAVGTVLLPEMARRLKAGDAAGALEGQNRAVEISLLLTLPAAAAFLITAHPIMEVLFRRGAFTSADATAAAGTLCAYALGLPAFVLIKSLVPAFHARQDTATPVRLALVAVAVNIGLKIMLMASLAQTGLALATAVSAWVNVTLLTVTLGRRGLYAPDARLRRRLPRVLLATAAMAGLLVLGKEWLTPTLTAPEGGVRFAALFLLCGGGLGAYGLIAWGLGGVTGSDLRRLRRSRKQN